MGNAVTLVVQLERDDGENRRRAGHPLRGRVKAEVHRRVRGSKVILHFYGKESVFIERGKNGRYYAKRPFFESQLVLSDLRNQDIEPGTYHYPFSVDLPESLPATVYKQGYYSNWCQVVYKAQARIGAEVRSTKTEITIRGAPMQNIQVPCFLEPRTTALKGLVGKQGSVTFAAGVNDTHCYRGQCVDLHLACLNNSAVDIQHVDVKLVELYEWKAKGHTEKIKRVLFQKENVDLPGLVTERVQRSSIPLDDRALREVHRENFQPLFEALRSPANRIRFRIHETARETYVGTIMSVTHYIKVYLHTRPMTDNPTVKIPLQIGSRPVQQPPQTATPVTIEPSNVPAVVLSDSVPMVEAVPAVRSSASYDPTGEPPLAPLSEAVVVGGSTVIDSSGTYPAASTAQLIDVIPLPPPVVPSFSSLMDEMLASIDDYNIISTKLQDPGWRLVFESLTPDQFGSVIANVNLDHDQPRVAVLLAPNLNGGENNFTCDFCVGALKNTARWNRSAMVERLLPFCQDLRTNHGKIREELTQWEAVTTERYFEEALGRA